MKRKKEEPHGLMHISEVLDYIYPELARNRKKKIEKEHQKELEVR